jgi:N-methylhydantoinase A
VAPFGAGVMSTVGFLAAPLAFDFVRSWPAGLEDIDWNRADALYGEMEAEGDDVLRSSGVAAPVHVREADMRYVGQGHEIRVAWPAGRDPAVVRTAFETEYRRLYGRLGPEDVPLEIISWRVRSSGPVPDLELRIGHEPGDAAKGVRRAYMPELGGMADVPVLDRYRLGPGSRFAGPAIVEERESTVVIGPGAEAEVDERFNVVVRMP